MASTILVVGATGNTGRSVVENLSELLKANNAFTGYRILALTRSLKGSVAQRLAKLPRVEVAEQDWTEVTTDWLRNHKVVRAFIASHNQPNQFAEESTFHLAALKAGVDYVVRISTTAANVRPDCPAYYPRSHWAIEALLSSPEFESMRWTSLQPNVFASTYLSSAAELIKSYRETGQIGTLKLMASRDVPVGIIDPNDVGRLAAFLLVEKDPTIHNKAKYVLNGPEDITGLQIVSMVARYIDSQVEDVRYKDMSFVDQLAATSTESRNIIMSIRHAAETAWEGKCTASTTDEEVLSLAAPRRTPAEVLASLLRE